MEHGSANRPTSHTSELQTSLSHAYSSCLSALDLDNRNASDWLDWLNVAAVEILESSKSKQVTPGYLMLRANSRRLDFNRHSRRRIQGLDVDGSVAKVWASPGAELEVADFLEFLFAQLSPQLSCALSCLIQNGYSSRNAATELKVSEATFRKRIQRARQEIKGLVYAN